MSNADAGKYRTGSREGSIVKLIKLVNLNLKLVQAKP